MRLLILTNNPDRASFRQRVEVYLDLLRENGICCEVARFPASISGRYLLLKRSADFDAVLLHKKRLNLLEAPLLRKFARKIIYDFDDAVMYSPHTPQRHSFSNWVRFRLTVKSADLVIAGNRYLADHARKFSTNVQVLPTGLSTNHYKVQVEPKSDGKIRLVWIGSRSTLKYLAEIKPVLEEIGSRFDKVVLRIICDEFIDLESMPVEKRPWSIETETADLAACNIGLAPLPDNRFTRGKCGFKILQYAAAGLPIIASPVGVHSAYILPNVNGFLPKDNMQWVECMAKLIQDAELRKTMGAAARQRVADFDLAVVGKRLCDVIKTCIGPSPSDDSV
jgi:glycosyltransferase involved in cell wall biosynthesis